MHSQNFQRVSLISKHTTAAKTIRPTQWYKTKHAFTCEGLLEDMAARTQDYVSDHVCLTTNTVEGFHCLALRKQTDLGHVHYVCKTNMAICHKASTIDV